LRFLKNLGLITAQTHALDTPQIHHPSISNRDASPHLP
jgi:hypothetical protein